MCGVDLHLVVIHCMLQVGVLVHEFYGQFDVCFPDGGAPSGHIFWVSYKIDQLYLVYFVLVVNCSIVVIDVLVDICVVVVLDCFM